MSTFNETPELTGLSQVLTVLGAIMEKLSQSKFLYNTEFMTWKQMANTKSVSFMLSISF